MALTAILTVTLKNTERQHLCSVAEVGQPFCHSMGLAPQPWSPVDLSGAQAADDRNRPGWGGGGARHGEEAVDKPGRYLRASFWRALNGRLRLSRRQRSGLQNTGGDSSVCLG